MTYKKIELTGEPLPIVVFLTAENSITGTKNFDDLCRSIFGHAGLFGISIFDFLSGKIIKTDELETALKKAQKQASAKGAVLIRIKIINGTDDISTSYFNGYEKTGFANVVRFMITQSGKLKVSENFGKLTDPILSRFDNPSKFIFTASLDLPTTELNKTEKNSDGETYLQEAIRYLMYGVSGVIEGS